MQHVSTGLGSLNVWPGRRAFGRTFGRAFGRRGELWPRCWVQVARLLQRKLLLRDVERLLWHWCQRRAVLELRNRPPVLRHGTALICFRSFRHERRLTARLLRSWEAAAALA